MDARAVGYTDDPATIGHLRRIFAACDEGQSLRAIAKGLEDDAILPPYHARTESTRWMRAILRDRVYIGEAEAFRTASFKVRDETRGCTVRRHRARPVADRVALPAGVAPIVIAPGVFARVQMRLDQNQARATDFRTTRNPEVGILRRGLAFCGLCGNKLVVITSRGVPCYRCEGRERTGCPSAVTIAVAQVDDAVWEWLGALLPDEDRVRRNIECARRDDPTLDDLATVDRQRAELEREQANFVAVIAKLDSPDAAGPIAAKLNLIAKQLQGCERNRADILARQAMWQREQEQISDVLATCRRVAEDMAVLRTWADRRAMAQKLRVRFELFPADHAPRWVATSEIVPDVMTSERSLYDTSACTAGM